MAAVLTKLWRNVRIWFLAGIVVLLPVWLTLFAIIWVFDHIDTAIVAPFHKYLGVTLPGLGILTAVVLTVLAGWLTTVILGQQMIKHGEKFMMRIPIVRAIYGAVKQVTDTLIGANQSAFTRVVLAEFPRVGVYSLGFVAGELPGTDLVRVWLPPGPSPTAGPVAMIPVDQLVFLPMSVEDGLKFIVSAGVLTPKDVDVTAIAEAETELRVRRRGRV